MCPESACVQELGRYTRLDERSMFSISRFNLYVVGRWQMLNRGSLLMTSKRLNVIYLSTSSPSRRYFPLRLLLRRKSAKDVWEGEIGSSRECVFTSGEARCRIIRRWSRGLSVGLRGSWALDEARAQSESGSPAHNFFWVPEAHPVMFCQSAYPTYQGISHHNHRSKDN